VLHTVFKHFEPIIYRYLFTFFDVAYNMDPSLSIGLILRILGIWNTGVMDPRDGEKYRLGCITTNRTETTNSLTVGRAFVVRIAF
jgi:hypothetical protein